MQLVEFLLSYIKNQSSKS